MALMATTKSSTTLWLLLAVFIVPIVLAKCALTFNWLNYGVTNKGQLTEQAITLTQLGLAEHDFNNQWLILVRVPQECNLHCQQGLSSIYNTFIALGRERSRVLPVALVEPQALEQFKRSDIHSQHWHTIEHPQQANQAINLGQVVIVDPLKNVVLTHQMPEDNSAFSLFGKQVLADMKKLLKYSRIG